MADKPLDVKWTGGERVGVREHKLQPKGQEANPLLAVREKKKKSFNNHYSYIPSPNMYTKRTIMRWRCCAHYIPYYLYYIYKKKFAKKFFSRVIKIHPFVTKHSNDKQKQREREGLEITTALGWVHFILLISFDIKEACFWNPWTSWVFACRIEVWREPWITSHLFFKCLLIVCSEYNVCYISDGGGRALPSSIGTDRSRTGLQ